MQHSCCVGIIASDSEVVFAKLPVGFPTRKPLSIVGSAITALAYDVAGGAVVALVYDDWVRHGDAASLGVGTGSTDNAHGDADSLGVGALGKDDAPPVAPVASWLQWRVRLRGSLLCNMLSMNSTKIKLKKMIDVCHCMCHQHTHVAGAISICCCRCQTGGRMEGWCDRNSHRHNPGEIQLTRLRWLMTANFWQQIKMSWIRWIHLYSKRAVLAFPYPCKIRPVQGNARNTWITEN